MRQKDSLQVKCYDYFRGSVMAPVIRLVRRQAHLESSCSSGVYGEKTDSEAGSYLLLRCTLSSFN